MNIQPLRKVEHKTVSFLVKNIDQDQGIVTGLASPMTNVDRQKDKVEPGAYANTLAEGQARIQSGRRYMCSTLWMHSPNEPTGGVINAEELPEGLSVTMQCDISVNSAGHPNNPIATMVFSGFKSGYIDELSIGYIATKYDYDKQGVRHLREIDLIEVSAVTMLFAANPEALVPASGVKSMFVQTKSVCGDTSLPIGSRDASWDGSTAHNQIVTWATKDDGSIDPTKMKQVHLQCDGDEDKITSYGYAFCDITDDKPVINVGGVKACASALSGARGADPGEDKTGMQKKVETLYGNINKKYPKDTPLVAPWKDDGKSMSSKLQRKDFDTLFRATQAADCLEDLGDLLNTFIQAAIQAFGMGDQPQEDMMQCVEQFGNAVMKWTADAMASNLKDYIAQRGYCGNDTPYVPYSMRVGGYDYSSRHDRISGKVGATISAATQGTLEQHQAEMKAMIDDHQKMMTESCNAMQDKMDGMSSMWNKPDDDSQQQDGNGKSIRLNLPTKSSNLTVDDLAKLLV